MHSLVQSVVKAVQVQEVHGVLIRIVDFSNLENPRSEQAFLFVY